MPQATDITVNNGSSVAKTFSLITPAAGDGGVAMWALKEGVISSVFPFFTASAVNKPTARGLKLKIGIPSSYTDTVTGLTMVKNRAEFNVSCTIPSDFPEALKDDWEAYVANIINHSLVRALIRDALSAT